MHSRGIPINLTITSYLNPANKILMRETRKKKTLRVRGEKKPKDGQGEGGGVCHSMITEHEAAERTCLLDFSTQLPLAADICP